ncbi:MAG: PilW family protein, partial [Planctomycetota bacterium]
MRGAVHPHRSDRGFTLLELLMAMSIFMFLSMLAVYLMRQGLDIFVTGTRESSLQDRTETVLPRLVEDLELLALPASFDPPPPAPTEEERMAGATYVPPPPVDVRLRATTLRLRDVPEGPLKDLPCTYVAWVTDVSGDLSDPLLRRAGLDWGPGRKDLTPTEVDRANPNTRYKPTGGLREVCYVAVPEDPEYPALLTLYYGWRSPVGGEASLHEPENLDTLRE